MDFLPSLTAHPVIPAYAGIPRFQSLALGPRFRDPVGWVERKANPSPALVAMGFAMLNPFHSSSPVNYLNASEN
jgi:hypothetical protein